MYHVALDKNGTMNLNWVLDYSKNEVIFEIHIPNDFGWFAIGFSDSGELFPADYCILWRDWKHQIVFEVTSNVNKTNLVESYIKMLF